MRSTFPVFEGVLQARNLSPKTIRNYLDTAELFAKFCDETFGPLDVAALTAEHVNAFIVDQLAAWTPSTAATRFRCLQQWFKHVEMIHGIASPMSGLRPPKVTDAPVPVLRDPELCRLLDVCAGESFVDRRDLAMFRLLIDAGVRRDELAGMQLDDVNREDRVIIVKGKGGQLRFVSFGAESDRALVAYLKARAEHAYSGDPDLWLGLRGPMTGSGVAQMVKRRSAEAGVERVFPHRFRHTFAHRWLVAGGNETDLQTLAGWRSSQMLARYGASARAERAAQAHRRLALGDSLR